jgi:Zn-dependent M28 family amino/carboxypeptidase
MQKLVYATALALCLSTTPVLAADPIDAARIARHIEVLASDSFEGRAPASAGEAKTVAYLIEQFRAAGVEPGGDLKNGTRAWTQDVPLARFAIDGPVQVSAGGETWTQGEQVALRASQTGARRLDLKDAPLVFAGYGVKADEKGWDDFKGMDLKGKVILVLVNDPDFETGAGDFGGKAMTYYGRWTYKYEEAARQGAAGVLVIHETAPAAYGWATVKNSNTAELFDIIRDDPTKAHAPLEGWIQRDAAAALLRKAGLDYEALKSQARSRDFRPVALPGVSLSASFAVNATTVISKNVVGVLPGRSRPEERVIYTAHWDHLGVGGADATGDRIYNGAADNASGVGALLELARVFASGPRPDRSLVFLAVTAEEKGLLGTEYYAAHPLYPLGSTVADLNMDGMNLVGLTRDVTMSGDAPLTLQDDLVKLAAERGLSFSPDPNPEAGSFYRSDHFPLAKRGVPAISFGAGQDLVEGGLAAGKAASDDYIRERYHQPADEFDPKWDLRGLSQEVGLFYELGRRLANSSVWPEWKTGAEFKAERDKTAAVRR